MRNMKERIYTFIPYLLLCVLYIGCIWYLDHYFVLELDDDAAAEMIFSHALAQDGQWRIMTEDWVYSTELRVFNTQIVYGFLFHFFTNWHTVRIVGNGIMILMLLCSVFYLCSVLNVKKYFPIIGALFIIPVSSSYWKFVIYGAYLPYIILPILVLALFFDVVRSNKNKQRILFLISVILSFGIGLGSMRQIILFFAPLLLACGFILYIKRGEIERDFLKNENVKKFILSLVLCVSSCFGFLINQIVLSKVYTLGKVLDYSHNITLQTFSFDRLEEVLNGWMDCLGYHYGMQITSIYILNNVMPLFLMGVLFIGLKQFIDRKDSLEKDQITMVAFFLTGFVLTILLFTFSDIYFHPRYLISLSVFSYFIVFLLYDRILKESIIKKVLLVFFGIFIIGFTFINLYNYSKVDLTKDMRDIANILIEKGYHEGFTTNSWTYGSGITEYTNGQVHVYKLSSKCEDIENLDGSALERSEDELWLEFKSTLNIVPEGKIFLIASVPITHLNEGDILYQNGSLTVYGYDSYELLLDDLNSKY